MMKDFSQRIADLSPQQKALLELRLAQKGIQKQKSQSQISPRNNSDSGVLSYAQERLWILHQLQPELPTYNEINLLQLTGSLNTVALEQSFNEVLKRHEVLRSKFTTIDGRPILLFSSSLSLALPIIEIHQNSQAESEAQALALAMQEARKPFDLSESPLFRIKLFRLSAQKYWLLMVMHHIISDGWSMGVFIQEIATLYTAFSDRKLPSLPELSIQYADFACWERQRLQNKILDPQLDYWKTKLSGSLPILEIPTIRSQTSTNNSSCGAIESVSLSLELTQQLKILSQQEDVTLFMLLLAAFKVLLYRYTDIDDILVGSPIANRNRQELEGLIGVFLNTLVLRSDLSGNPTFQELLQRVKEVALGAYSHQDLPFEKLVQELSPERNINQSPLFQVMFILHNLPGSELALPGLSVEQLGIDNGIALFDLTLEIRETALGLSASFEYNCARFEQCQIQQMLGHYQTLLESVVANPQLRLSQIDLLPKAEKQQLLHEFNYNRRNYPVRQTIDRLFEAQVAKTPSKVAVVAGQNQLTYQELNDRANQVARLLQSLELQTGDFVGILQQRNSNFAIAILAVLKAGGVYVPIEHSYPAERIAYMLDRSEVKFLLTDSLCLDQFSATLEACTNLQQIICLDSLGSLRGESRDTGVPSDLDNSSQVTVKIARPSDYALLATENFRVSTSGSDPAYMIYTSGSTGLPKGAIITHGGAINHIYAQFDALKVTADFRFLQSAPASSDISVWQLLAPLLIGGTTVIVEKEIVCQPAKLLQIIQQEKLTLVELVPVILRNLIDYISSLPSSQRALDYLKAMMVTGESVSVELVNQWLNLYPVISVINAYGPTEAADDVTQLIIEDTLPENQITVPIGKPLANLNLYILDRQMQLVPIGIPGEICVSGFGVGLGYWRDEEKTNLSFVPNPFPETAKLLPGIKTDFIYKTGDLGRWLPDGNIEFLGRIDRQVKVRGFRIELGEIEAVLNRHPAIAQSVVVVREDNSGHKQLVAYLVLKQQSLTSSDIRSFLKEKLPSYMLPSAVMILESFPLTANGKIDRQSLPLPDETRPELGAKFVTPTSFLEKTLAAIWAEVLNVKQIGIEDNFFELGGDSILSINAIFLANQQGLKLTPIDLFQHQTISELARVVEKNGYNSIQKREFSFTPIQCQLLKENRNNLYQWRLLATKTRINSEYLEQTIEQLFNHHQVLRAQCLAEQQVISLGGKTPPLSQLDLSALSTREQQIAIDRVIEQVSGTRSREVLGQVVWLNLGQQDYLLFAFSSLIIDQVSWEVILGDCQAAYQQLSKQKTVSLAPITTSYGQWTEKLSEYAQSASFRSELDFWLLQQEMIASMSSPPTDYSGESSTPESSTQTYTVEISAAETQTVLEQVTTTYRVGVDELLLTAWTSAWIEWMGNPTVAIDLIDRHREQIFPDLDLSRTVGCLTIVYPVTLQLLSSQLPENLKEVKTKLRLIPHQGIGYGILRYLTPDFPLSSLSPPKLSFTYRGQLEHNCNDDTVFTLVKSSPSVSSQSYWLEIDTFIADNCLHLSANYNDQKYQKKTIAKLMSSFETNLRSLISHSQSGEIQEYIPADFPLASLNESDLNLALGAIEFEEV